MTVWQPIKTAPKDGSAILIFDNGSIGIAVWFAQTWRLMAYVGRYEAPAYDEDYSPETAAMPSHWATLPTPPQSPEPR